MVSAFIIYALNIVLWCDDCALPTRHHIQTNFTLIFTYICYMSRIYNVLFQKMQDKLLIKMYV